MPSVAEVITATDAAIAQDPANARVSIHTKGHLTGATEVTLRSGRHTVLVDEPAGLAGNDAAPGPIDYALVALASCQAITYRFWAERLGIALDDVEVTVEADIDLRGFFGLDDAVRPGFTEVRVETTPVGPDTAERYRELQQAADEHCPVLDLFANTTPVRHGLTVSA